MLSTQHQRTLLSHIKHAEEPSVAFKVGGLDVLAAMDKVQAHDETTQDSGSGSGYSDISALENETDEFGRRILQHQRETQYQRDQQRISNAIRPGQQAFRKARPRPRLAERLEQERQLESAQNGQSHERTGSGGSNDSEPLLNLPRQWGRKARKRSEWARKLEADAQANAPLPDSNGQQEVQRQDEDAIMPHRTLYTGDEDWVAVADEPLASIETTPPSMRRPRPNSTPTSMGHMNTTLADALGTDDQDFASASLLASTPAVNRRNRRIDELTRREIESIEKRGVTKRTLEQILEQSAAKSTEPRPVSAPSGDTARVPRRRRSLIANKENIAPNGEVNANYKGTETVGLVSRTAEAVTFKTAQRPAHIRSDSYNLLKRLARVSSMSPSPAREKTQPEVKEKRPKSQPAVDLGPLSAKSTNSDFIAMQRPYSSAGGHAKPSTPMLDTEQPPALNEEDAATPIQPEAEVPDSDVTPAPQASHLDAKTPVVTGAWVDTPGPQTDIRPLLKATDSTIVRAFGSPSGAAALEMDHDPLQETHRRIHSEPLHAKSALADVLKEVKGQNDEQLGDTTIQSLEDMANPDLDPTDPTLTIDIEQVAQEVADAIEAGEPSTQAEKDRRQERLAIEAMNKHLRAARTSIKDANRGLRRVESRIETVQAGPSTEPTAPVTNVIVGPQSGKHGKTICATCGGTYYTSIWKALAIEFLECFAVYDRSSPLRVRFTWLGLACLTWLLWYILELTLCSFYCHQLYAERMTAYGVDPEAPSFPFVIPTLVFRPLRPVWRPAYESLAWCLGVLGNAMFGSGVDVTEPARLDLGASTLRYGEAPSGGGAGGNYGEGLFGSKWAKTATAVMASTSSRVVHSALDAVDEVGSMWDDETLS